MPVWYKFRSSVGFDELDVGGVGIRVRELRAEVLRRKGLPVSHDFDLLVSDAETGQVYEDEEFEIPDRSSVIIKRVPSGQPARADPDGKRGDALEAIAPLPSEDVGTEKFDDFGVDLYPALEALPPESDTDVGNVDSTAHKKDGLVPRCSEASISRRQNFEGSDLSEAMSKATGNLNENHVEIGDVHENEKPSIKPKSEGQKKLDEGLGLSSPKMLNAELPSELRCLLCNGIFKEAVMIPCCQHSFCDRCVCSALVERARCPKCGSTKCAVEDLLPNLSLRQAIEHFLEARVAINGPNNIISKYIPDGESGIQAKEVSCSVSIRQKEPQIPHSPSATGKGSNQVTPESVYDYDNKRSRGIGSRGIHLNADKSGKSAPLLLKIKHIKRDENSSAVASKQMESSSSKLPQNVLQEEAKKKGSGVHPADESGVPMPPSKHRKGDRNCFMCGSPHHLIRDCPVASNSYPMQIGDAALPGSMPAYGQPYWQGTPFPHVRPYGSFYGAPGMMPFDPTIHPVGTFGIPSYFPSFYSSMPMPYGFMRMGGLPPAMMTGTERPVARSEFMYLQGGEQKQKHLNEHIERELDYESISEDSHYRGAQRRYHELKHEIDRETTRSYSDNGSPRIHKNSHDKQFYSSSCQRPDFSSDEEFHSIDPKHEKVSYASFSGRGPRTLHSEKSMSEVQDVSDSSNHRSRERKKHYPNRSSSKKPSERKGHAASDCSQRSHHRSRKEMSEDDEKVATDHKRYNHKHHNLSALGLELDSSSDRKQLQKEKESSHSSRHKLETTDELLEDDRWEMVDGSDDEYRGEYHRHRCKRTR